MIFIATGGVFNLMGFSMASRSPETEKPLKTPLNIIFDFSREPLDFCPCTTYDVNEPEKCPYVYFGRPNRTAKSYIMEQRIDLNQMKLPSFWRQIEGTEGPTPDCDVFNKDLKTCSDNTYCC